MSGYHFAGKTGTAEKLKAAGGGYEAGHYIASFCRIWSGRRYPQIAALVIIDDPKGVYYGSEIAAPVWGNYNPGNALSWYPAAK